MTTASKTAVESATGGPGPLLRRIDSPVDAERAFVHIYGASANAFWLDSSAAGRRGRFSFMGDSQGPLGAVITYDVETGMVRSERGGEVETREESIFAYLKRELGLLEPLGAGLPFDFDCGFAGYLGYELKAECDGAAAHRAATPDAAFIFAGRMIAFDHREDCAYLLCIAGDGDGARWIEETSRRLQALPPLEDPEPVGGAPQRPCLRRTRRRYLDDIAACKRYLAAGHSYEICLTNRILAESDREPLDLYRSLRRSNPVPFAAYLRFGDLAVLSASPERFVSVDRAGWAESRPIKGTSRRGGTATDDATLAAALASDEKSRAENVTIVDLVRNDLGRVCEVGSVGVPELMTVETYETVHHLVSSVRGRLHEGIGAIDCVRACFPPGSMTGAPKVRTMEIIDELEGEARGVYSGAIGYLGLGGGCDLNVAIRTIVLDDGLATVGAGGAIVVQSEPEAEFEEMLLKARGPASVLKSNLSAPGDAAPITFAPRHRPEQEPWP
jgi:para-aminobenzoate synthetase